MGKRVTWKCRCKRRRTVDICVDAGGAEEKQEATEDGGGWVRAWPSAPVPSRSPFRSSQVEAFWNSFRHGPVGPWSVSQFQLSILAHSRWVPTALGKVALAMPSPVAHD